MDGPGGLELGLIISLGLVTSGNLSQHGPVSRSNKILLTAAMCGFCLDLDIVFDLSIRCLFRSFVRLQDLYVMPIH